MHDIILYTNNSCTWANRANVALAELGLAFEQRILDVDAARPDEFLAINPRGLVPVLIFDGEVIIESAIICQFLADKFPSQLWPPSTTSPLFRARLSFFNDSYWTKFHLILFQLFEAPTVTEEEMVVQQAVAGLVSQVEPLLTDAAPYFGGSTKLTLAEVMMGPFVSRALALSRRGVYPPSLHQEVCKLAPNFFRWATTTSKHPSIAALIEEDVIVARSKAKRARMRMAAGLTP